MTITDLPHHRPEVDGAQLLFEEARRRRRRRWFITGITTAVVAVLVAITGFVVSTHGGGTVGPATPPPLPAASTAVGSAAAFSLRPVLCYAPAYSVPAGQSPTPGPPPVCAPDSRLTATNIGVVPDSINVNGYSSDTNVQPDPQFATYPTTPSSTTHPKWEALLPGRPGETSVRYVVGPVGLDRGAVAAARVIHSGGQWSVDVTLTARGSAQWDALASDQFHAIVGVVIDGQVVSAPITEPTQRSFTSFDGRFQISGFTEHQATVIASHL